MQSANAAGRVPGVHRFESGLPPWGLARPSRPEAVTSGRATWLVQYDRLQASYRQHRSPFSSGEGNPTQ